ncbi:MAG: alpha/beta hydrolase family protein [Bryobacteraceae bacterium]
MRRTLMLGLAVAAFAVCATQEQERQWRAQIRRALMVPEPLPPLHPKVHGEFEPVPGVAAQRVTYGTQFGMRIPAIVYSPKDRKTARGPALIVVNGHGGDKYTWYSFWCGILYARAGAVVLTFDPTGEGERNKNRQTGTRAHDRLEPVNAPWHAELARRQGGLIVGDVMQAVSYLLTRPDVDPARVGAMGYSMGSFIVALTGAVDPRLYACVVAAGGGLQIPKGDFVPARSKPSCIQGYPYRSLAFLKDPPAVIYALHASRGPTLVVNGELDWDGKPRATATPAWYEALRQRTIAFRGSANGIFDIGAFERGAIHRPYFVNRDVALWLHHHMQFPAWSAAAIATMPETYIRDWAAREKVEIDKSYTTEGLESGAHALGDAIPGLTREQLSVFSAAEWEREKDQLILESWVSRTLKQMGR